MTLTFLRPEYFWLLLALPLLALLYAYSLRRRRRQALSFSRLALIKEATAKRHRVLEHLPFALLLLALALMIVGFADPNIPLSQAKEGVNVVLAMDISGSMRARDFSPNRLEAAKRAAEALLDELGPKDHAGIVIFESGATTAAYLSPFKDRVIRRLRGVESSGGTTAIGDGLSLAVDMASSIPNKKRVVVLLSDGVSNSGVISPREAIAFAKANSIQVNTIGLGTNGRSLVGYDAYGRPQFAELDERTLRMIAEETGGEYYQSVDSATLADIYRRVGENIEREEELTSIRDWCFAAAALLMLAQIYVSYGRLRIVGAGA